MSTVNGWQWFRGEAIWPAGSASPAPSWSYRGEFVGPSSPEPPTWSVSDVDSAPVGDGLKAVSGGSFGPFDDFQDFVGELLEDHSPNPGPGSWSKHASYSTGSLRVVLARRAVARGVASTYSSLYLTDVSGEDVRATWTIGDDSGGAQDVKAGVGLRVSTSADSGYFAVSLNDGSTHQWAILKRAAGVETPLATASKPNVLLTPAALDFSVVGSHLELKVNGATVATADDSDVSGSGRFGLLFVPVTYPMPFAAGTWIDDLSIGSAASPVSLSPESLFASTRQGDSALVPEASATLASVVSFLVVPGSDSSPASESGSVRSFASQRESWAWSPTSRTLASPSASDSADWRESIPSLAAAASVPDSTGTSEVANPTGVATAVDTVSASLLALLSAAAGTVDSFDSATSREGSTVLASFVATDFLDCLETFANATTAVVAVFDSDAASGLDSDAIAALVRGSDSFVAFETTAFASVAATVGFNLYRASISGGPIDYDFPVATTTEYSWTSPPLGKPGVWSFAVRASGPGGEEKNLDAAVTIRLDLSGVDVSGIPNAPTSATARARAGGVVRVEWRQDRVDSGRSAAGFRIYKGIGSVDFSTPAATVPNDGRPYPFAELSGLADGSTYVFAVRAFNFLGESDGEAVATAVADATGPPPVAGLSVTASSSE